MSNKRANQKASKHSVGERAEVWRARAVLGRKIHLGSLATPGLPGSDRFWKTWG